jgi:hypothetical protein
MKAIDLSAASLTLLEILSLASEDNVILRTPEGRQFVLAEIDDFAEEVEKVCRNSALMQLLDQRSREKADLTLKEVQDRLRPRKRRPKSQK